MVDAATLKRMEENQAFWKKRNDEILRYVDAMDGELVHEVRRAYNRMYREVEKKLESFFAKYAEDNAISLQDARAKLRGTDLEYYRQSVEDYREYLRNLPPEDGRRKQMEEMLAEYVKASNVSRLDGLMHDIVGELAEMGYNLHGDMDAHFQAVAQYTYRNAWYDFGASSTLNRPAVQQLFKHPFNGSTFADHIWGNVGRLKYNLQKTFMQGFTQGLSVRQMGMAMRKEFNVTRAQAETIVRTEGNHVINNATLQRYADAGLQFARIHVHVDDRTSDICTAHHEEDKKYAIGEETDGILPAHVNCRSTWIPDREELMDEHWETQIDPLDREDLTWDERVKAKIKQMQENGEDWTLDDVIKTGKQARENALGDIMEDSAVFERNYKKADADYREKWDLEQKLARIARKEKTQEAIDAVNEMSQARAAAARKLLDMRAKRGQINYGIEMADLLEQVRDVGGKFKAQGPRSPSALVSRINGFTQYLPTGWVDGFNKQKLMVRQSKGRSFFRPGAIHLEDGWLSSIKKPNVSQLTDVYGGIFLEKDGSSGTALHEMMHVFENRVKEISQIQGEFYEKRTKGESLQRLRDVTGNHGYGAHEVTKVDDFVNPYMGRHYNDGAYELLSMGIEALYTSPASLAKDEEYIDFLMGVLLTH